MNSADRDKIRAVGGVEAVEIRGVLEVVGVELAILQGGVRQYIVVENLDVKLIAFGGQVVLDEFEDLGVRHGGGSDHHGANDLLGLSSSFKSGHTAEALGQVLRDLFGLQNLQQGLDTGILFIADLDSDDVGVGLRGVAGGILECQCVVGLIAGVERVVQVDNGQRSFVAVLQLSGERIGLYGGDGKAAVVLDIKLGHAVFHRGALGQFDETLLLEQEQGTSHIGVVSRDKDRSTGRDVLEIGDGFTVDAERLIVDSADRDEIGTVGSVEAVEIRGVLEVVGVELAILQGGVRQHIVVKNLDLERIAFGGQIFTDKFQNLGMRHGGGTDHNGRKISGESRAAQAEQADSKRQRQDQRQCFFHVVYPLYYNITNVDVNQTKNTGFTFVHGASWRRQADEESISLARPLVTLLNDFITADLNDLDDNDHQQHADPFDIRVAALVSIDDGDLAETGAADRSGHGRIAEDRHHGDRRPGQQRRLCLGDQDLGNDLEVVRAHSLGRFDNTGVDFLQRGFDKSGHIGRRCDHQHNDDSLVAETRANDQLCHREHCDHQNDKRNRTEEVDNEAEDAVEPADRVNPAVVGNVQNHAERQTDDIGDSGGDQRHINGLPYAKLQQSLIPELQKHIRKLHRSSLLSPLDLAVFQPDQNFLRLLRVARQFDDHVPVHHAVELAGIGKQDVDRRLTAEHHL